ncbi:MAG: hypothetical protein O3A51_13035 [Verrucomicrobia bacterium]|nr:hypothetical protein [Verrucomicrobiota bacterium]
MPLIQPPKHINPVMRITRPARREWRRPSLDTIVLRVCEYLDNGATAMDVKGKRRFPNISEARSLFHASAHAWYSFPEISKWRGKDSHSTALASTQRLLATDAGRAQVAALRLEQPAASDASVMGGKLAGKFMSDKRHRKFFNDVCLESPA